MRPALPTLALLAISACTVSGGAPPDAAPCALSSAFFVETVRLDYLDRYHCTDPTCHDFSTGHGYYRLRPFGNPPAPTDPISAWPPSWRDNYLQSIQLLDCPDPTKSRLYTVPAGLADPHPAGDVIDDHPSAELLFQQWAAAR